MVTTKYARDLGLLEKYQLSKHLTRAYGTVNVTGHLSHPPLQGGENHHSFYVAHLAPALTRLLHRHPLLSVVMRDVHSGKAHFEQLSSVNLVHLVQIGTPGQSLEGIMQEQASFDYVLDNTQPLWHICVTPIDHQSCNITLTAHHVIADGMSLSVLWKEFLEELNNSSPVEQQHNWVVEIPADTTVALPYELSNPPALSLFTDTLPLVFNSVSSKVLPTFVSKYFNPSLTSWKGDFPAIEGDGHNTDVRSFKVESSEWEPLMKKAKENGISPHAIAFISVLLAWTKVYPDNGSVVETTTPINCRPVCNPPVPKTQVGNFVGSYSTFWTNDATLRNYQKNPWALAKKYHNDLQKNKVDGAKQALLLKYLPEFPSSYYDFWADKRKNSDMGRTGGIEFSDLGRFDVPTISKGNWQLGDLYFCQSAQIYTTAYSVNGVTANGSLYCTLTWQKGALKGEHIDQLIPAFEDVIKAFLEN